MRIEFIELVKQPGFSMAEACRKYGISRKTGYKWLNRYAEKGVAGLTEHSKRPHSQPNRLSEAVVLRIVNIRVEHKYWGADKIRSILRREGVLPLPGRTTIHRILKQSGLINLRKKRRVKLEKSKGFIAGEFVMSYPPGIPIVAPGERITADVLEHILFAKAKGCFMTGTEDMSLEYVNVLA